MTPARTRLLAVLALAAATLVLFAAFERYQVRQPQMLKNGDFSSGLSAWRTTGGAGQLQLDQGILQIRSERAGQSPGIRQIIERGPGMDRLRLSAWVRYSGVTSGLRAWHAMRLLLVQRNSHGDICGRPRCCKVDFWFWHSLRAVICPACLMRYV
ncbi:MAG: hypothetical protein QGF20_05860 [Alphaproteobacteria bacterium]|jgi:hypothetical protein|nr:hypothetical protein [Alphaproteobacteria bacterium]